MIRIYCSKADATLQETETLTAGMVNTPVVQFTFSSDWDGLGKSAIVRAGTIIKEVIVSNNQIVVPSECLAKAGVNLIIGVWGGNFTTELPTVWCACGEIQDATNPNSALNHEEGTASNVAQMLAAAERAEAALNQIENANWEDVAQKVGAEKVNKPLTDPNGSEGQILKTNGDGSTLWVDPPDIFDEEIDTAIGNWLDEHPEATTTVQDDSLTENKLTPEYADYLKRRHRGGNITPIYIGDYLSLTEYLPSCVVKIGNYFYAVDAHTRAYCQTNDTNIGKVRRFDIVNNVEDTEFAKDVDVGHANSVAYDSVNNLVYIAPVFVMDNGTETRPNFLYKYDSNMNYIGIENIPTNAMGLSFDNKTKTLYYLDYSFKIYRKENESWVQVTTVDMPSRASLISTNSYYNQDIAIYDNEFYISSPAGTIVFGELTAETSKVIGTYSVNYYDTLGRFTLGELEGMEFDENGHLFCVDYIRIDNAILNAFICELPVGKTVQYASQSWDAALTNFTYTLSEATQKKFSLGPYDIRSLSQMIITSQKNNQAASVTVPEDNVVVEPDLVTIARDLQLNINGIYSVNRIRIYRGLFVLNSDSSNGARTLIFRLNDIAGIGAGLIGIERSGQLSITGSQAIIISIPNFSASESRLLYFIGIGTSYSRVLIRVLPVSIEGYTLGIGGRELEGFTQYQGSGIVVSDGNLERSKEILNIPYLNSRLITVPAHKKYKITFSLWSKGLLWISSIYANSMWLYIFQCYTGNQHRFIPILEGTNTNMGIEINENGSESGIIITNNYGAAVTVAAISFGGSLTMNYTDVT